MRITLRTSNNADGNLSLYQAAQHFNALVKANGLLPAIRTTLSTARQIFFRDGGGVSFRGGQIESNDAPVIRGAPRRWASGVRHLIGIHNYYQLNGYQSDHIDFIVARLRELIDISPNSPEHARVTVVIPAFNSFHEVANCLESIFSHVGRTNFKVVIADDASPNISYDVLSVLNGVEISRQHLNLGYIGNVNSATLNLNTEFLLTLNQDVIVCPGWLDELVLEAEKHPTAGIFGPQMLDQDFQILEAGGLIFQDAHAAHRGRGAESDDVRYNFSCDVDYVSGCAMLVRTALWNQLGGLDVQYAPAYYDDTDFCLRARKNGWRVRYAALSHIVHFEGTSMGANEHDLSSLKHFQVVNREKVAVNHPELIGHTSVEHFPRVESHCQKGMKVVCVYESMPDAKRDSGSIDSVLFLDYLVELGYSVSALFYSEAALEKTFQWRSEGIQCVQLESDLGMDLLSSSTLTVSFGIVASLNLKDRGFEKKKWINFTSDCATRRLRLMLDTKSQDKAISSESVRWYSGLPQKVPQMWEIEKPTFEIPAATLFVTPHDMNFATENGAQGNFIHFPILRGGPDLLPITEPIHDMTVGFVGSFLHSPNPDAVEYFIREIWPSIYEEIPNSRFLIWGSNINDRQKSIWSEFSGVEVRGYFDTWNEVVAQTRVLVSPLRFGAGMKGKVVSSLIHGRPVVGTNPSFEGFDTQHLSQNVMTDDPQVMARSLIEILRSDSAWLEALKAGLLGMGNEYARSREIERVRNLVDGLLFQ